MSRHSTDPQKWLKNRDFAAFFDHYCGSVLVLVAVQPGEDELSEPPALMRCAGSLCDSLRVGAALAMGATDTGHGASVTAAPHWFPRLRISHGRIFRGHWRGNAAQQLTRRKRRKIGDFLYFSAFSAGQF
ncbi:hypothetical protein [Arthrobacter glacialis]|uniref:Uncharacterized protein n=1 Tax=Arthrobacter glacialis TaxID=1664 RepID=A0A2S3ZUS9_ARTGL|nr:hypothetical protein [Arthrobacter glacialis]POH73015.1 hypothetical protein CVS27_12675 [Arthrobacter glacialis]